MNTPELQFCRRQRGFNLVEVLVALLVLAIGVLGAAAMQMNALKFNQTAAVRSQATFLAYDIVDRMRANRAAARGGDYDLAFADGKPNGATISAEDIDAWLTQIEAQLPAGDGEIDRAGDSVTIRIRWDESRIGGANDQTFEFVTEL